MRIEEITVTSQLYKVAMELRYTLFFKDFNLSKSVTADELEPVSFHIVITEGKELLAYGRLSPLESKVFRISQIVVPKKYRHKGYASTLLSKLIELGISKGAETLQLNSQLSVKELYLRLGFKVVSDVYKVKITGIEHVKMEYHVHT